VATQTYEERPAAGGADTFRWTPASYDSTDHSAEEIVWVGPGTKLEGDQDAFNKYYLQIPVGSSIIKTKVTTKARGASIASPNNGNFLSMPLLKLGFLASDGFWDQVPALPGIKGAQDEVHFISQVLDTSSSQIFLTSTSRNGPDLAMWPAIDGYGSFGMKFKAGATQTLGSILIRAQRTTGATPNNLVMKVYAPVSASDPRPGVLLATSDLVALSSVPLVYGQASPPVNWVVFSFPVGEQFSMTSGSEYVYVLEYDTPPIAGGAKVQWANDDDRTQNPVPAKVGNLPVADVWGIFNDPTSGFHRAFYFNDDLMPTALFSGIPFTDPFFPGTAPVPNGYFNVWGDAAYSPDVELPLTSMIQTYIDDAGYDEDGTMLGIYVETHDPDEGVDFGWEASTSPTKLGMILTIEYTEPVPGKATDPNPPHLSTIIGADLLSWTTGTYAGTAPVTHNVYFGTNPSPGAGEFQGNQPGNTFDPGELLPGMIYYWRIDEVGEFETTTGDIWQFRVVHGSLALIRMVESLVAGLGIGLAKPATPDLVPDAPEGLEVPETPKLRVSPHPAMVAPPGAKLELVEAGEDTALETPESPDLASPAPDVSIKPDRGKLE
jgi:hypothetical protein